MSIASRVILSWLALGPLRVEGAHAAELAPEADVAAVAGQQAGPASGSPATEGWGRCSSEPVSNPVASCVRQSDPRGSVLIVTEGGESDRLRVSIGGALTRLPACGGTGPAFLRSEVLDAALLTGNPYGALREGPVADAFALAEVSGATEGTRKLVRGLLKQRSQLARSASNLGFVTVVSSSPGGYSVVTWAGAVRLNEAFLATENSDDPQRVSEAVAASFENSPPRVLLEVRQDHGYGERGVVLDEVRRCVSPTSGSSATGAELNVVDTPGAGVQVQVGKGAPLAFSALGSLDEAPASLRFRWWVDDVQQAEQSGRLLLPPARDGDLPRTVRVQVRDPEMGEGGEFTVGLRELEGPQLTASPRHQTVQVLGSWVETVVPQRVGGDDRWVADTRPQAGTPAFENPGVRFLVSPLEGDDFVGTGSARASSYVWRQVDTGRPLRCSDVSLVTSTAWTDPTGGCDDRAGPMTVTTLRPALVVVPALPGRYSFEVVGVKGRVPSEPVTVTVEALYTWFTATATLRQHRDLSLQPTRTERVLVASVGVDALGPRVGAGVLRGPPTVQVGPVAGFSPSMLSSAGEAPRLLSPQLVYGGVGFQFDTAAFDGRSEIRNNGPSPNSVAWRHGVTALVAGEVGGALEFSSPGEPSELWNAGACPYRQAGACFGAPYVRADLALRYRRSRMGWSLGPYVWYVPVPHAGPPVLGVASALTWYPFGATSSAANLERTPERTEAIFGSAQSRWELGLRERVSEHYCRQADSLRLVEVVQHDTLELQGERPVALRRPVELRFRATASTTEGDWFVEPLFPDDQWTRWVVPASAPMGEVSLVLPREAVARNGDGIFVLSYRGEVRMVFETAGAVRCWDGRMPGLQTTSADPPATPPTPAPAP